jgi:hypothetical protein
MALLSQVKARENSPLFHKSILKIWILKHTLDGSSKNIKRAEAMLVLH